MSGPGTGRRLSEGKKETFRRGAGRFLVVLFPMSLLIGARLAGTFRISLSIPWRQMLLSGDRFLFRSSAATRPTRSRREAYFFFVVFFVDFFDEDFFEPFFIGIPVTSFLV